MAPVIRVVPLILLVSVGFAFADSGTKRTKSDRNIALILHREIVHRQVLLSIEQERQIGDAAAAQLEVNKPLLGDSGIVEYVERLAATLARNSDVRFPITLKIIDSDDVQARTLPAGHLYITRGLLLRMQSEGELAGVLARGLAHVALRSSMQLNSRRMAGDMAGVALIFVGGKSAPDMGTATPVTPLTLLRYTRELELDADYFGIQYLYKAGYSAECFITAMEHALPPVLQTGKPRELDAFPSFAERVKLLRKEMSELLPQRGNDLVSTPEFENFRQRLRTWEASPTLTNERP